MDSGFAPAARPGIRRKTLRSAQNDLQARIHPGRGGDSGNRAGRMVARIRAAAADAGGPPFLRSTRQRHSRPPDRHSRAAHAGAVSRAFDQSRRRRRARTGAACHRARLSRSLQDPGRQRAGLCADLGGFCRARQELRPARRPRPHRDRAESHPRRARRPHRVPRRRRHLAEQLHVHAQHGPGHGRLHGAVEARRHGRPLGVHARGRARQGDHREARLPVPGAEHPRHRMERRRRSSR